jgi:hypothetical protein
VYRHFDRSVASGCFSGFRLIRCTKKDVFDAHLVTISSAKTIVTSVLENFITEICSGVPDEEVQLFAHQQITAHVEALSALTSRLPEVSVTICPPMFRSTPSWYASYLPDFLGFLASEISRVGTGRLVLCPPFIVVPSLLESDGIHLIPQGGDRFLAHVDSHLKSLTSASASTWSSEDPTVETEATPLLDSLESVGAVVMQLVRSTTAFETVARRRFKNDDFIFARLKEEADADVNRSREDRVVITGLPSPRTPSSSHADKKRHYSDVVTRLITLSCVSADPLPRVADVYINLRKDRGVHLVEVKLDSVTGAQLFRRESVRLAKAEHEEFSTLFFSNSVTQATRVRIEILKALSKKLTTATEDAYIQGFISRPVLQYRVKEGASSTADGVGRSYNFVDSMVKFGSRLMPSDLTVAYTRAGSTFRGAMSQYFIVLSDEHVLSGERSGVNRIPIGGRGSRGGRGRPWSRGGRGTSISRGGYRTLEFSSAPDVSTSEDGARRFPSLTDVPERGTKGAAEPVGTPSLTDVPERGTKRAAEPAGTPSKRNETVSVVEME